MDLKHLSPEARARRELMQDRVDDFFTGSAVTASAPRSQRAPSRADLVDRQMSALLAAGDYRGADQLADSYEYRSTLPSFKPTLDEYIIRVYGSMAAYTQAREYEKMGYPLELQRQILRIYNSMDELLAAKARQEYRDKQAALDAEEAAAAAAKKKPKKLKPTPSDRQNGYTAAGNWTLAFDPAAPPSTPWIR